MPDPRCLCRTRRRLAVLLALVLLVASVAATGDPGSSHSGSLRLVERVVPVVPADEKAAPVAVTSTPRAVSVGDAGGAGPVIASVSPPIASAGTITTITIRGTGFGVRSTIGSAADVGFTSVGGVYWASGRTSPLNADEILSWSDTVVTVRVPTGYLADGSSDTASSGTLRLVTESGQSTAVPFAVSFGAGGATWASAPVFLVNDNCPGVAGGADAVRRAAATWNAALPATFRIDCSGTTAASVVAPDDVSVIAWGSPAEATIWTDGDGTILEADILLDPETNWTTGIAGGSAYSIESRMLEAFGYCLGIASLAGTGPQGPSDTGKACCLWRDDALGNMNLVTLSPADRAAVDYLYGGGSANPPLLAAAFRADTLAGPAPLTVRFADASLGGASGWAWDFGDGGTSMAEAPVHVYAAPGTYTVGLTASAPGYPGDTVRALQRIAVTGAAVAVVPGGTAVPTSTANDGLCDDVNGNGRADFADVVLYFTQLVWIAENEPVAAFDYNANGRIDFADVVRGFTDL